MSQCKALLVGINAYPEAPLRGCVNDVLQMKQLLVQYCGFSQQDLRILLDNEATFAGIEAGLEWLAQGGGDPESVRLFHYSGHGSYVVDLNGDEPDGRDECLVPFDYLTRDMLTDDALKQMYERFPRDSNLTLVMDSCHSGSVQKDLTENVIYRFLPVSLEGLEAMDRAAAKFSEDQQNYVIKRLGELDRQSLTEQEFEREVRRLMLSFEKKRFGDIRVREANILLAGCRDNQQSADAMIDGSFHGAFTYYLAETIAAHAGKIAYGDLAEQVGKKLYDNRFTQTPQLECSGKNRNRLAFEPF